jgi:pimeloyl-ACP methyl ester carboxylesterase
MNTIYKSPAGEAEVMALYDKALAFWPVPHDEYRLPTRIGQTFIIASGPEQAPSLVLLHGAGSNALSWMGEAGAYSQHFRTFAIDIPGDPGRSAPSRPSWNGNAYADWLADVLDGLGIERSAVLGLSQGGWNALRFATLYPERVTRLVLLSPAGVTADRGSFLLRAVVLTRFGKRGADALNRYVFGGDEIDPAALVFMNTIMENFKPRIESLKTFSEAELRRVTMPVVLLGGAKDVIRDVSKISARMAEFLPQLTTHIFPERGHVLVGTAQYLIPLLLPLAEG